MKTEEKIDDLLCYLELGEQKYIGTKFDRVPLSYFKEADPHLLSNEFSVLDEEFEWFDLKETPASLGEPLDYTILRDVKDGGKFSVARFRSVAPKEVRGRVATIARQMVECSYAAIDENGDYVSVRKIMGTNEKNFVSGMWKCIDARFHGMNRVLRPVAGEDEYNTAYIGIACNQQFLANYNWKVAIYGESGSSLGFYTTHDGAKDIFRLRDVLPGRVRRSMLSNWIKDHWRIIPSKSESIKVDKHMRGLQDFEWRGLRVKIYPPLVEYKKWQEEILGKTA